MAFPTLSRRPLKASATYEENLVSSDAEAGYEHRRKKFTRTRQPLEVMYDLLPTADRDLLMDHFLIVGQYTAFDWTDLEGNVHSVFYAKPPKWESAGFSGYFQFDTLEFFEQ